MELPKPKDLSEAVGISPSYASMILGGSRHPSMAMALSIYSKLGLRFGPLRGLSDEAIAELAQNQDEAA